MDPLTEYFNAERGRRVALADGLNISPGAVSQWDRVPAERVLEIERLTGISRHDLRPDVFGPPPDIKVAPAAPADGKAA